MTTGKKILCAFVTAMVPMLLFAFASGPDPRHTAAPGDDPLACASVGCHTGSFKGGPINASGGSVSATFSDGSSYTPGKSITITVSVSDPVNTFHGFQMTARLESNLSTGQAGRFSYVSGSGVFVICDNGQPRTSAGSCPASAPVEFIEHNAPRTGTWTFTWTPPATAQGPVHFYIAGNAVNNNGIPDGGDHVYTNEYVLSTCGGSIPTITEVRRIEGWGDGSTFASGSWLEVKGSNFAPITRAWGAADFNGPNAPTSLDGVSVNVHGKPGFIEAISPGQINLQAPDDNFLGSVPVTVTNCAGTSAAFTAPKLQKVDVAPGILAPPLSISPFFFIGGKQYAQATIDFQFLLVGNLDPILPSRPAKPGDLIQLYAIGLGPTTPANSAGVAVTGTDPLKVNAPISVKFGDTPATLVQAALYPGFTGMYYLAVTVPDVPDGDYQINLTVNGAALVQDPFYLTVHK